MVARVVWPLLGVSFWQIAFRERHKNDFLDQEVIDLTEYPVKCICIAMIPLGVMVNICGWYSSRLTNLITVYELLWIITAMLVPFNYGDY